MRSPVFIHIPRTGGNSLLPHLADKKVQVVHHVEKEDLSRYRDDWLFAFLRDPCQRVISAYAYLRDGGRSEQDNTDADVYVRPFASLEDFVLHGLEKASANQRHFRPQHYWLTDEQGKVAATFLGRTERLQADFNRVCEVCGWPEVQLGTENASRRDGLICTDAMREVISRVYAEDCRLLQKCEADAATDLMGKITKVYQKNYPNEIRDVVWNQCMARASQTEVTEAQLQNMCQTTLVTGFGGGGGRPEAIRLAECLGVCGISNPENDAHNQRHIPATKNVDDLGIDEILDRVQPLLPFPIWFPPFSGNCLQGTMTKFGVMSNRHIFYLWILKRIMELCPDPNSPVIEVGAGFGLLGYYLHGMGYRDYTVIDLALVNACQTYFLTQNLPGRKLILSGDVPDPFDPCHRDAIKLLHTTDFHDVPKGRFAIMINMDGLTEYGLEEAKKYVQSDCAKILLSINHEVNGYRVLDIEQPHRKLAERKLFWLRPGYVEELYV